MSNVIKCTIKNPSSDAIKIKNISIHPCIKFYKLVNTNFNHLTQICKQYFLCSVSTLLELKALVVSSNPIRCNFLLLDLVLRRKTSNTNTLPKMVKRLKNPGNGNLFQLKIFTNPSLFLHQCTFIMYRSKYTLQVSGELLMHL